MTINFLKISQFLFWIGLFFIPFNSFEGFPYLGEFTKEPAAVFFAMAFCSLVGYFIKGGAWVTFSRLSVAQWLWLFVGICFFSFIVNFADIDSYFFKKTTGTVRFFRQFFVLLVVAFLYVVLFVNVFYSYKIKTLFE